MTHKYFFPATLFLRLFPDRISVDRDNNEIWVYNKNNGYWMVMDVVEKSMKENGWIVTIDNFDKYWAKTIKKIKEA